MPVLAPRQAGSPASQLYLSIHEKLYLVEPLACDRRVALRAFRLSKGDGTLYDVAQTGFGPQCDCPDFIFRRDGLDPAGCKHVKALVAQGLIEPQRVSDNSRMVRSSIVDLFSPGT